METQDKRYSAIRAKTGLSNQDFAASLGIAPSLSSSIESGSREASRDVLTRLATVYNVNINWFLTGKKDSTVSLSETESDIVQIEYIRQEAAAGRGADIEDFPVTSAIPVLRSFVAPYKSAQLRAVTVRGDSMTGKEIFDKDVVIFCPRETDGDGIYVISVSGKLLVKRVAFNLISNELTLISENPQYPPRSIRGEELAGVKIEGRVIACLHRL
jgi:phage repressor protein C with HTH and peptisase S24 domain